jgi:N-acetylglucosaminyl-diphospho-decaprenol L-rhamnosyltransferase
MVVAPHTYLGDVQTVPLLKKHRPKITVTLAPRLTVVIVNYHQWENTAALTAQLRASRCMRSGAAEVVIVDNHSPPHPLAARLRRWSGVSLRRWGKNRGFARAVNEGCRLGLGEWLLLLNPDITVTRKFLDEILSLADRVTAAEPRTGIVGFGLRNTDGSRQMSSGLFPTLVRTVASLALPRSRRKYHAVAEDQRSQVEWVTGCCLLVRRACLESLGGLDEDYFLYYEDVDLCRRARARGWSVWFEPAQQAIHHHPLHSRPVPPALRLITRHSLLTYGLKHWPRWQVRVLAGIIRVESWARQLRAWWRGEARAAFLCRQLRALAADMAGGRRKTARRRLLRVTEGETLWVPNLEE